MKYTIVYTSNLESKKKFGHDFFACSFSAIIFGLFKNSAGLNFESFKYSALAFLEIPRNIASLDMILLCDKLIGSKFVNAA